MITIAFGNFRPLLHFCGKVINFSFVRNRPSVFVKMVMKGLTWATLKKEPALIPLFVIIGMGCVGCIFYTTRLALRNPDVAWVKRDHQPFDEYANKQYKFYSPNLDYSKIQSQAPKY